MLCFRAKELLEQKREEKARAEKEVVSDYYITK